jgi:hypothetical protein
MSMYLAAKSAMAFFTRSMAMELAGDNIRVNAIAPGTVATDMVRNNPDEVQQAMVDAPADQTHGRSRRDGAGGGVSGLGRLVVHDRPGDGARRRHDQALTARAPRSPIGRRRRAEPGRTLHRDGGLGHTGGHEQRELHVGRRQPSRIRLPGGARHRPRLGRAAGGRRRIGAARHPGAQLSRVGPGQAGAPHRPGAPVRRRPGRPAGARGHRPGTSSTSGAPPTTASRRRGSPGTAAGPNSSWPCSTTPHPTRRCGPGETINTPPSGPAGWPTRP